MRAKTTFCMLVCASMLGGGCATVGARTGPAAIALQTEAGTATSVAGADKEGRSCSQNILGIVAIGDSSIASAKTTGQITTVSSVDYKLLSILGFYGRVCTIVRGS
ncbi:MAG: TRL-like family protein [Myxococcota bacterium]